jgi:hypothetical protein
MEKSELEKNPIETAPFFKLTRPAVCLECLKALLPQADHGDDEADADQTQPHVQQEILFCLTKIFNMITLD